jgi:hypothetical protein
VLNNTARVWDLKYLINCRNLVMTLLMFICWLVTHKVEFDSLVAHSKSMVFPVISAVSINYILIVYQFLKCFQVPSTNQIIAAMLSSWIQLIKNFHVEFLSITHIIKKFHNFITVYVGNLLGSTVIIMCTILHSLYTIYWWVMCNSHYEQQLYS